MASPERCAHDGCTCRVEGPKAYVQDGRMFCSSGCAAGEGCEHSSCNCAPGAATPVKSG